MANCLCPYSVHFFLSTIGEIKSDSGVCLPHWFGCGCCIWVFLGSIANDGIYFFSAQPAETKKKKNFVKSFSGGLVVRILRPIKSNAWTPVVPSYCVEMRASRAICSMPHSLIKPWPRRPKNARTHTTITTGTAIHQTWGLRNMVIAPASHSRRNAHFRQKALQNWSVWAHFILNFVCFIFGLGKEEHILQFSKSVKKVAATLAKAFCVNSIRRTSECQIMRSAGLSRSLTSLLWCEVQRACE